MFRELAHENYFRGLAHEILFRGLAHEIIFRGLAHEGLWASWQRMVSPWAFMSQPISVHGLVGNVRES